MINPKVLDLRKDTYSDFIGAYDNIIVRFGALEKFLRALGLSHFWVVEKTIENPT